MTNQKAFNAVWQHFVVEKQPRSVAESGCAYRGDNGAKCAVGVLIPDDVFAEANAHKKLEGLMVGCLLDNPVLFGPGSLFEHVDRVFLGSLQVAHDSFAGAPSKFTEYMKDELAHTAKFYNLTIPEAGGVPA